MQFSSLKSPLTTLLIVMSFPVLAATVAENGTFCFRLRNLSRLLFSQTNTSKPTESVSTISPSVRDRAVADQHPPSIAGIADFSGMRPFAGGGQADVYRQSEEPMVYRTPRDQSLDFDSLYEEMAATVGDQMPHYHGSKTVLITDRNGKVVARKAYVFDLVDNKTYIAPNLENYRTTPTEIRQRVAKSLLRLKAKMEVRGYFPGDMKVDNYVFNPATGDVLIYPDTGIFLPLQSQYITGHQDALQRQIDRWLEPQLSGHE